MGAQKGHIDSNYGFQNIHMGRVIFFWATYIYYGYIMLSKALDPYIILLQENTCVEDQKKLGGDLNRD